MQVRSCSGPDILEVSDVDSGFGPLGLVTLNLPGKTKKKSGDGDTLKRRLLGAAVLIALAVIFLPLVLDGSGSESRFRRVEQLRMQPPRIIGVDGVLEAPRPESKPANPVSPPAAAPSTSVPSAAKTDAPNPSPSLPQAAQNDAAEVAEPATNTPDTVQRRSQSPSGSSDVRELVAWIVQAGSFSDELNALSLRDALRKQGFPTFVTLADSGQSVLYRVKVGPMTDLAKAETSQRRIEEIIGRETLVRRYP